MHPDETRIYLAILTGVLILVALMTFSIATIIRYQKKKVALHLERIKAEIISLEKERARIASDLHDDLGASLSAIKLRLQCLEPGDHNETLLVKESEFYIDEAMQKLRRISFDMIPQILQRKGLAEALNELIEMLTHATGIRINYECTLDSIDKERRIHIYRMAAEIMNNILRHAGATIINFSIKKAAGKIQLHIQDNGVGFDKNMVSKKIAGQGLQNIMSRADLLKARIHLSTEPGKGVDYLIEIPDEQ